MGERARVIHLITRLDPGGSAENTVLSAEHVDPERFESLVWTGPGLMGGGPPPVYRHRLADRLEVLPRLVRPISPLTDLRALLDLVGRLRRARPDIIHLHSAKAGALGRVAARLARTGAKVIYTPHGHVFSGYGGETVSRLFVAAEKALAPLADAIVGLTADEARAFREHGAGRGEQFVVVPSGVDCSGCSADPVEVRSAWGLPGDVPVVGFVGRLETVKGPDLFLRMAAKVRQSRGDVRFLVIGNGSMADWLEAESARRGLQDVVIWAGWREDARRLLSAVDLLALTSRNEGQGRVLVEAMACEKPVVAMNTGGVGEVVAHGHTGLLVAPGAVDEAAGAVIELLDDPARREAMGRAGAQRARARFSIAEMIRRLERLYGGLLEGRRPDEILPPETL